MTREIRDRAELAQVAVMPLRLTFYGLLAEELKQWPSHYPPGAETSTDVLGSDSFSVVDRGPPRIRCGTRSVILRRTPHELGMAGRPQPH